MPPTSLTRTYIHSHLPIRPNMKVKIKEKKRKEKKRKEKKKKERKRKEPVM